MVQLLRILSASILLVGLEAASHPVSYQDGIGIMSYNSEQMNEVLLTYSFNPRVAAAHTYLRNSNSELYIPRVNLLLKRWNELDSQANVYFSAGTGVEEFEKKMSNVHLAEVVLDWESRKYYTYLEHLYLRRDTNRNSMLLKQDFHHSKLRLGFAPFLADYEELNIWFITQFERHNERRGIETTQFLRFYRKNVLWEIGASFDGAFAFNFMIHL